MTVAEQTSISEAMTSEQIAACFDIMRQLRPHLSDPPTFIAQVQRQIAEGYHLIYLQEVHTIKALAGYRILEFLAWGKVLYIDDLITDTTARKQGHADKLLNWIFNQAKLAGCDQVHLDSGHLRHDAHRLYLNHGFTIIGYHFARTETNSL